MAEQHRIGDRAEERRADQGAQHRHGRVPAGVESGGDQTDHPDGHRHEVEGRREFGSRRHVGFAAGAERSIPVIAATRAVRRSCSARCPRTPARRRAIDTPNPSRHPAATPSAAASRTGTAPNATPAAKAPSAMAR